MGDLTPVVLYSDDSIIVINKPAGLIVNNAKTSAEKFTLQDFINENFPVELDKTNEGTDFFLRSGIVHRLDKETSGVIVIARNIDAFNNLQKQFKERIVSKVYIALVHGKLVPEGIINVPIGRLPWNRMRFGVIPMGRESSTEFKALEYKLLKADHYKEVLTLVEIYPKTGRTHQIRVHFQYVGFPIFGDEFYAGRKTFIKDRKFLNRHFLHASQISFMHPVSNKNITFKAPLSIELVSFLKSLSDYKISSN